MAGAGYWMAASHLSPARRVAIAEDGLCWRGLDRGCRVCVCVGARARARACACAYYIAVEELEGLQEGIIGIP